MGELSYMEQLMSKALHEKRMKVVWALGTAVFTVLSTTATVSWQVRGYIDRLEHEGEKLRGELLVMAKNVESLQDAQKEDRKELKEVRQRADSALLYAQLTQQKKDRP
jgi:hypothetical protein